MTASQIIFYLISAFILGAGLLAVTTLKVFRAAIWLLFSLIGIAALYFWMEVEFIAAVQVIVYVGGIVVLIIFSIFLTQHAGTAMDKPATMRTIAAAIAALLGFALTWMLIQQYGFQASGKTFEWSMQTIGTQMLGTG
ncbi:MAG: NADH-quinone oxidoreductase subunit J, partial [Chitinophagales bacterium]|nr:NADH-quinone oxidoreductase subunit J [Chitinophagales bacterium]